MEWGKDDFIPARCAFFCALGIKRVKAAEVPSFSKLSRAIYIYKNILFIISSASFNVTYETYEIGHSCFKNYFLAQSFPQMLRE